MAIVEAIKGVEVTLEIGTEDDDYGAPFIRIYVEAVNGEPLAELVIDDRASADAVAAVIKEAHWLFIGGVKANGEDHR